MALSKLVCLSFLFFFTGSIADAKEFIVGGRADAWKVPLAAAQQTLNQWASSMRFQVGDSLVWSQNESVLEVTRPDYLACNTSSPKADHTYNGTTATVRLDRPGPYYFISGVDGACHEGEKLAVVVMAPHHRGGGGSSSSKLTTVAAGPALAPSPMLFEDGPAVPPTSRAARMLLVGADVLVGAVLIGLGTLVL